MGFERALRTDACEVSYYGNFFYVNWLRPAPLDDFLAVAQAKRALRERLGGGLLASLGVVSAGAFNKPSRELKAEIDREMDATTGWYAAEGMVIVSDGFASSMLRSFIAGMMMLRRYDHPHKVMATLDEASAWIAPFVKTPRGVATAAELRAHM